MEMLRRWTARSNGGSMERSREDDERREMMELSRPLLNLRQRIDRMFEDFFDDLPMPSRRTGSMMMGGERRFQPRMDLSETANAFKVTADVPGMSEDDIDITVSDNNLIINGERYEEREEREENFMRRERSYGRFHRQIPLPEQIDRDNINARFKNGVLTVEMPKTEEAKSQWRKIEVKSE